MSLHHHSQLFRQLREVDPQDFQRIIRLYEEKETEIGRLDVLENFELTVHYADALFETGAYRQHQMMVDLVIETSMRHNITRVEGIDKDVFQHLLFNKAVSAFRLQRYDTSIHVARELIRIDPSQKNNEQFLRAVLFRQQTGLLQFGRAAFIFCMLVTALVIVLDLLIVRSFYPTQTDLTQWAVAAIFVLGLLLLAGAYNYAWLRAYRQAARFRRSRENK